LPFACHYFSMSIWIASATVLLSYATGLNLEASALAPYQHPDWVRPVEFGIIGLGFTFDTWWHYK
jgi:alpha-1,6-mannosyltransferase